MQSGVAETKAHHLLNRTFSITRVQEVRMEVIVNPSQPMVLRNFKRYRADTVLSLGAYHDKGRVNSRLSRSTF